MGLEHGAKTVGVPDEGIGRSEEQRVIRSDDKSVCGLKFAEKIDGDCCYDSRTLGCLATEGQSRNRGAKASRT